jgi:hypothetical protein
LLREEEKMHVRRQALIPVVVSAFVLIWSGAWGDFYVIPAAKRAERTVLVSPKSTPAESGNALLNALHAITDASKDNPYLLILEPGIYDVGTNSVDMKSFVDIQGSGRYTTVILGAVEGVSKGVVNGANLADLRWLTVENKHAGDDAVAIYNGAGSPRITHVRARAGGEGATRNYGIYNSDSSAVLAHVEVVAQDKNATTNYGIYNLRSNVRMNDVTAEASGSSADN